MPKQAHTSNDKGAPFKGDWHVSNSSMGMGDYYGSAIKAKVGRIREGYGQVQATHDQLTKPPKSLA